jgi:hypothetical protein
MGGGLIRGMNELYVYEKTGGAALAPAWFET